MGEFVQIIDADVRPVEARSEGFLRPQALQFAPMAGLVGATVAAAAFTAAALDLQWLHLIPFFVIAGTLVTLLVILGAVFAQVCFMAMARHPDPLKQLRSTWFRRSLLLRLILPTIAVPLFMAGFVTLKAGATMAIPYNWDRLLTDIDYALFGVDPWVPLHQALNVWFIPDFLQFAYLGWQLLLPGSLAAAAIWMKPKDAAIFYSAMFLTWIVAGVIGAALLHSAGPIFAYIFDDDLGARFEPLNASLQQVLSYSDSRILRVHTALALAVGDHDVSQGGGISAMPSVHVAVTAIYVCAAWRYRFWRAAALVFAAIIWVGSVYFGYHYVTDGPFGFAIAVGCWIAVARFIGRQRYRNNQSSWTRFEGFSRFNSRKFFPVSKADVSPD